MVHIVARARYIEDEAMGPDSIKAPDSVQNFKTQLKTLVFQKEFNELYGPLTSVRCVVLTVGYQTLFTIIGGKGPKGILY